MGALGALAVKAATNVLAEIDLTQVSVAVGVIGAAVGVGIAENISRDTTTASVSEAQVSAPSVSVDALVAVDFSRTQTAGVAATTGLAVNVNKAKVDIGATTLAEARNGAVLNGVGVTTASGRTPGLVSVNAQGTYYGKAYSKAITGGVIGVGVMSAETVLQGSLKAVVDNASLRGDVVGVTARATTDRNGEAGLLAEARSLEVGGLTISVDSARLSTSLDARGNLQPRADRGHAAEHLGQPGAVGGCQHGRRHHRPGGGPAGQDRGRHRRLVLCRHRRRGAGHRQQGRYPRQQHGARRIRAQRLFGQAGGRRRQQA